jgi:hypothetical protein
VEETQGYKVPTVQHIKVKMLNEKTHRKPYRRSVEACKCIVWGPISDGQALLSNFMLLERQS